MDNLLVSLSKRVYAIQEEERVLREDDAFQNKIGEKCPEAIRLVVLKHIEKLNLKREIEREILRMKGV